MLWRCTLPLEAAMTAMLKTGSTRAQRALQHFVPEGYRISDDLFLALSDRQWAVLLDPLTDWTSMFWRILVKTPGHQKWWNLSRPPPARQQHDVWFGPHAEQLQPADCRALALELPSEPTAQHVNRQGKNYCRTVHRHQQPLAGASSSSAALHAPVCTGASAVQSSKRRRIGYHLSSSNHEPAPLQVQAQPQGPASQHDEQNIPPTNASSAYWALQAAATDVHGHEQAAGALHADHGQCAGHQQQVYNKHGMPVINGYATFQAAGCPGNAQQAADALARRRAQEHAIGQWQVDSQAYQQMQALLQVQQQQAAAAAYATF